ncbi:MAG: helix-turn-helix transcriptional regulator [Treponematales bacterium]
MTDLRRLLADNMKMYRGALGLSQAKLAEKISSAPNYIALIEMKKRFPSPDKLEQIAAALEVDTTQLFSKKPSEEETIRKLRANIITDIEKVIDLRLRELKDG